jgi:hypothetical protein
LRVLLDQLVALSIGLRNISLKCLEVRLVDGVASRRDLLVLVGLDVFAHLEAEDALAKLEPVGLRRWLDRLSIVVRIGRRIHDDPALDRVGRRRWSIFVFARYFSLSHRVAVFHQGAGAFLKVAVACRFVNLVLVLLRLLLVLGLQAGLARDDLPPHVLIHF